ncbi:AtpZ/AtpI family protein [Acidiphilium sp. AL]|nr:AtpZ/AtpI family protein [Acidiphilium iwatense]MCU4159253.1 AtpZ/AtpI family protein [Acidiphilium sp. AL]
MDDDPAKGHDDRTTFDQRLAAARNRAGLDKPKPVAEPQADGPNPFSLAMRLGAEMVASLVVAVAIGYGLDRLFHSSPWFMIGFVPIGAAAGLRNVIRVMGPAKKD